MVLEYLVGQDSNKIPCLCSRAKNVVAAARPPVRFFSAEAPVVDLYLGQLDQVRLKEVSPQPGAFPLAVSRRPCPCPCRWSVSGVWRRCPSSSSTPRGALTPWLLGRKCSTSPRNWPNRSENTATDAAARNRPFEQVHWLGIILGLKQIAEFLTVLFPHRCSLLLLTAGGVRASAGS